MRSKRLASHSNTKSTSSSSSTSAAAAAAADAAAADAAAAAVDSRPQATEDSQSSDGGTARRSPLQTPSPSKLLPEPSAHAAAPVATSRRSERKRKPREFGGRNSSALRQKKVWSEPDELALLKGTLAFRSQTGAFPKQPSMAAFFASIKRSIAPHLTAEQVRYKLKRLKSKFVHLSSAGLAASATAHERRVYELSSEIWAEEAKQADGDAEEDVNGDAADAEEEDEACEEDKYPFIREAAADFCKMNGRFMSGALLEKGLKLIDPSKGRELEEKMMKQCEAEVQLWTKRLDLLKEISKMLMEAQKGSRL